MKALFVGQRVRILFSHTWPELAGQEGRIVGKSTEKGLSGISEWQVAPDCWGTWEAPTPVIRFGADGNPRRVRWFAPNSSQLEPILPEGHKPCEESFKEELDNEFLKERETVKA